MTKKYKRMLVDNVSKESLEQFPILHRLIDNVLNNGREDFDLTGKKEEIKNLYSHIISKNDCSLAPFVWGALVFEEEVRKLCVDLKWKPEDELSFKYICGVSMTFEVDWLIDNKHLTSRQLDIIVSELFGTMKLNAHIRDDVVESLCFVAKKKVISNQLVRKLMKLNSLPIMLKLLENKSIDEKLRQEIQLNCIVHV